MYERSIEVILLQTDSLPHFPLYVDNPTVVTTYCLPLKR